MEFLGQEENRRYTPFIFPKYTSKVFFNPIPPQNQATSNTSKNPRSAIPWRYFALIKYLLRNSEGIPNNDMAFSNILLNGLLGVNYILPNIYYDPAQNDDDDSSLSSSLSIYDEDQTPYNFTDIP
jgi:hypothetical protein